MVRTLARFLGLGVVAVAMTVTPAFASGGSGSGGSGGGGGTTTTCGGLTLAVGGYIPNPPTANTSYGVQATGKTSNCLPLNSYLAVRFDDTTPAIGSCAVPSWTFIPATYNAYGAKMIDNYRSTSFYLPPDGCAIAPHTFTGILYMRTAGGGLAAGTVLGTASALWDPSIPYSLV